MAQNTTVKVITNAYLLDGTGKKPIKNATIVIKGNIIEDVEKTLEAPKEVE